MSKATGGDEDTRSKRKRGHQAHKSQPNVGKTRASGTPNKSKLPPHAKTGTSDQKAPVESAQAAAQTAMGVPSTDDEGLRGKLGHGKRGGPSDASIRQGAPSTPPTQQESSVKTDSSNWPAATSAGTAPSPNTVATTNEPSEAASPTSVQAGPAVPSLTDPSEAVSPTSVQAGPAAPSLTDPSEAVSLTSAQAGPAVPSLTDRSTAVVSGPFIQSEAAADGQRRKSLLPRLPGFKRHSSVQATKKLTSHGLENISIPISPAKSTRVPVEKRRYVGIACSNAIVVFVLTCVVVIFLRIAPKPPNRFCQTEGCIRHAQLLTVDLNRSIDPCQNFSAYVCSSWFKRQSADYLHYSKSAMDDVRKSWFPSFQDMLRDGSRALHAGRKPFLMYSACMASPSQYGSDVNKFREFQDTLRVPWPKTPEARHARALDVLMTLAFKWHLPIWVRIREPPSASVLNWRLFMDPGPLIPLMRQHHLSSRIDEYVRYWTSFYNHLGYERDKPELDRAAIEAMHAMEGSVLNSLYAARMPEVLQPLMIPVASIGVHTPPLQSEQWLQALEQLKMDVDVIPGDLVLLSDAGFFRTFGQVFANYSNAQLLELIAWSFVQLCAPAADYRLLVVRYGTDAATNKYKPYFCERFVESLYGLLVVALYSVTRLTQHQRAFVTAAFDSLVAAAASAVNATPWMDEESRLLAAKKLSSTRLLLWPPDQYLENGTIEELYEAFPSEGLSFVDYWVTASRSTAAAYRSLSDADAFGFPVNYALPYHRYDAPLGTVKVAVGAVTKPLYYADGTKAMFYGGLGFLMALSLVKALDSQGLKWRSNGTFGDSFLSRKSMAAFADKDGCLEASSADNGGGQRGGSKGAAGKTASSVFPEIPALEVAYAAYRVSVQEAKDDFSQRLPTGLSGDKVFFLTVCYMMCSRERGIDCNKAVRNFAPFANAFRCARGTAMNPDRKCTFFGPL